MREGIHGVDGLLRGCRASDGVRVAPGEHASCVLHIHSVPAALTWMGHGCS